MKDWFLQFATWLDDQGHNSLAGAMDKFNTNLEIVTEYMNDNPPPGQGFFERIAIGIALATLLTIVG